MVLVDAIFKTGDEIARTVNLPGITTRQYIHEELQEQ
jgi:hypothetical protein